MLIEHSVIQLLGCGLQRPIQRPEIGHPAVGGVQRLAANGGFDLERVSVDAPVGAALRFGREVVGGVEGGRLGDLENAHLTPMYLWVWTLSRHLGWLRQ